MAPQKQPCTCTECKLYWTYIDDYGVERPGQPRDKKVIKHRKRRDLYYGDHAQDTHRAPLSPESTVLLATMSDIFNKFAFEESVAVHTRDGVSHDEVSSTLERRLCAH